MRVVITGGPSAGKTTVVNALKKNFYDEIYVVKESASIIYSGGFPRKVSAEAKPCQQRAIYCVQKELEQIAAIEAPSCLHVCDRGSLDGLAYWLGTEDEFFSVNSTNRQAELGRYDCVIHLQVMPKSHYNNENSKIRVETWEQAKEIDEKLKAIWSQHGNYHLVEETISFWDKINEVSEIVRALLEKRESSLV
jgi:predicted ATPase